MASPTNKLTVHAFKKPSTTHSSTNPPLIPTTEYPRSILTVQESKEPSLI